MPRLRALTGTEGKNRAFMAALAAQMTYENKSTQDVAYGIGMTYATFNRRTKDPETFTVGELRRLKAYFPRLEIII